MIYFEVAIATKLIKIDSTCYANRFFPINTSQRWFSILVASYKTLQKAYL